MRFACLGSGSKGNAWVVQANDTRIMVDCGFGPRETARRLQRLGVELEQIDAILVTHEHSDHGRGAAKTAERARCPVYLSHGSHAMLDATGDAPCAVHRISAQEHFDLKDMHITAYTVPHDAREPLQFAFSDGARRFALLTDAGHATPHMEAMLSDCDAIALECNHDVERLRNGSYPAALKRRILGPWGHLDNEAAAALLGKVAGPRLKHIVAAHLSEENNSPDLARGALASALHCTPDWIAVADQEDGLAWRTL
ncbi:MAG: MBL fold metallo-hydrolase [Betaproteobacteria bacterium]|nr:MBL fold metallo-hydrolase [Betaproteobacteria bacterium]